MSGLSAIYRRFSFVVSTCVGWYSFFLSILNYGLTASNYLSYSIYGGSANLLLLLLSQLNCNTGLCCSAIFCKSSHIHCNPIFYINIHLILRIDCIKSLCYNNILNDDRGDINVTDNAGKNKRDTLSV